MTLDSLTHLTHKTSVLELRKHQRLEPQLTIVVKNKEREETDTTIKRFCTPRFIALARPQYQFASLGAARGKNCSVMESTFLKIWTVFSRLILLLLFTMCASKLFEVIKSNLPEFFFWVVASDRIGCSGEHKETNNNNNTLFHPIICIK